MLSEMLAQWMNKLVNVWVVLPWGIWEECGVWGGGRWWGDRFECEFCSLFLVGVRSWENYLTPVFFFVKGEPEINSLRVLLEGLEMIDVKCLIQGRCPLKEGFLSLLPHAVPGTQWAFRKCLMTEESPAPFIWVIHTQKLHLLHPMGCCSQLGKSPVSWLAHPSSLPGVYSSL